jgi:hypothetical protein
MLWCLLHHIHSTWEHCTYIHMVSKHDPVVYSIYVKSYKNLKEIINLTFIIDASWLMHNPAGHVLHYHMTKLFTP